MSWKYPKHWARGRETEDAFDREAAKIDCIKKIRDAEEWENKKEHWDKLYSVCGEEKRNSIGNTRGNGLGKF